MAQGSFQPPVPLLGAWSFEQGGSVVHDSSSHGLHGTILGTPQWVPGKVGLALQFDGVTNAVRLPPNVTTDTVTFVTWVKGDPMASWTGLLYARDPVQPVGINYRSSTRQLSYTWNNDSPTTFNWSGGPTVPSNEWALVALSIEPTRAVLYVVSTSTDMQAHTNAIPHGPQTLDTEFFLGHDVHSPTRRFRGLVDEVRIFDGALTAAHIQALYDSDR
jgi:arabinan endo-1,5-alpha-L-arabinosidase